jgi:hypothetical protein
MIVAIKNSYKPLCKQESDNLWCRGKLLISIKRATYLSAFFFSVGVPNGEFPEILIAKCRSKFYCTWFFSRTEDFESWREGRCCNYLLAVKHIIMLQIKTITSVLKVLTLNIIASIHVNLPAGAFFSRFWGSLRPSRQLSKSSVREKNQVQ